jgi:AcrR family transcriptional regulator
MPASMPRRGEYATPLRRGEAETGVGDIVAATGVNRSSLYATFGGKRDLYLSALRRYTEEQSRPAFTRLAADGRGLPAIREFFAELIDARCSGEHARWGCMVANAHLGAERDDQAVMKILDCHFDQLRGAMRAALEAAQARGQLRIQAIPGTAAELLALLAYAVNLRSRAGAGAATLRTAIASALSLIEAGRP